MEGGATAELAAGYREHAGSSAKIPARKEVKTLCLLDKNRPPGLAPAAVMATIKTSMETTLNAVGSNMQQCMKQGLSAFTGRRFLAELTHDGPPPCWCPWLCRKLSRRDVPAFTSAVKQSRRPAPGLLFALMAPIPHRCSVIKDGKEVPASLGPFAGILPARTPKRGGLDGRELVKSTLFGSFLVSRRGLEPRTY